MNMKDIFLWFPFKTFCKILNRLEEEGIIKTTSKGIYSINCDNDNEDSILNFYTNDESGLVVGYKLYNDLGITTHQESPIVIYTNAMNTTVKNIGDKYRLELFDLIMFDEHIKKLIICLELIQNKIKIIDVDLFKLASILMDYLQDYHDIDLEMILNKHKYQYSTLISLEELLTKLNIKNRVMDIAREYLK